MNYILLVKKFILLINSILYVLFPQNEFKYTIVVIIIKALEF